MASEGLGSELWLPEVIQAGLYLQRSFCQGNVAWEAETDSGQSRYSIPCMLNKQLELSSHFHVSRMFHSFYRALGCLAGIEWATCYGHPDGR